MEIYLPGDLLLFIHMQEDLRHVKGNRVTLTKGIHHALADFCWMMQDLERYPTRLYKLVLLHPTLDSYHDASGYMCGGGVLPGPTTVPRTLQTQTSAVKTTLDPTGAHPIF